MQCVLFRITFLVLLPGFILTEGETNKYVVSNQKLTFHEAFLRCRQYGLDPAEIFSQKDQDEVEDALKMEKEIGTPNGFWIFATNLGDKVNFYWLNSDLPLFYSAFPVGLPDNVGNKENCLQIFQSSTSKFVWNDCPCESKIRFICQYKQKSNDPCDSNRVLRL